MRSQAEQEACSQAKSCRYLKKQKLRIEQEKLESMIKLQLENGESLSSDVLLEQSKLIDNLVVDEMLLNDLKQKL